MGWMWGLLAILLVLVVVGFLVARGRAASGRDDDAVTGGPPEVDGPPEVPVTAPPATGTAGTADPGSAARPARAAGPRVDDAARAEGAPGAWDDDDRPAGPSAVTETPDTAAETTARPGGPGGAAPAGAVPEQAGPADPPAPAAEPASDTGDEPGPTGRHALRDDAEHRPLPEVDLPEQAGPPEPSPVLPSRSGGSAAAAGSAAAGGSALAALDSGLIGPAAASDPVPQGTRPGPFPGSVLAPEDGSDPPETHRVKVHSGSRRFHTPESPYYVRTRADLYFTGESAARAAGFTAWNERPSAV